MLLTNYMSTELPAQVAIKIGRAFHKQFVLKAKTADSPQANDANQILGRHIWAVLNGEHVDTDEGITTTPSGWLDACAKLMRAVQVSGAIATLTVATEMSFSGPPESEEKVTAAAVDTLEAATRNIRGVESMTAECDPVTRTEMLHAELPRVMRQTAACHSTEHMKVGTVEELREDYTGVYQTRIARCAANPARGSLGPVSDQCSAHTLNLLTLLVRKSGLFEGKMLELLNNRLSSLHHVLFEMPAGGKTIEVHLSGAMLTHAPEESFQRLKGVMDLAMKQAIQADLQTRTGLDISDMKKAFKGAATFLKCERDKRLGLCGPSSAAGSGGATYDGK